MASEYGIPCHIDTLPYVAARWPVPLRDDAPSLTLPYAGVSQVIDRQDRPVLLFESDWAMNYCAEKNPDYRLEDSL
jgi:peptide subunit release factor RF-3